MLGLRADAEKVHWAVVEGPQSLPIVIDHEDAAAPKDFGEAEALGWFHDRIVYLIRQYNPTVIAVRLPESNALGRGEGFRRRLRIEGVLMAAGRALRIRVEHGALATIAKRLQTDKTTAKNFVANGDLRGLDLKKLPGPRREAVLVAVAMLPAT